MLQLKRMKLLLELCCWAEDKWLSLEIAPHFAITYMTETACNLQLYNNCDLGHKQCINHSSDSLHKIGPLYIRTITFFFFADDGKHINFSVMDLRSTGILQH
jgi:hypothetical protein